VHASRSTTALPLFQGNCRGIREAQEYEKKGPYWSFPRTFNVGPPEGVGAALPIVIVEAPPSATLSDPQKSLVATWRSKFIEHLKIANGGSLPCDEEDIWIKVAIKRSDRIDTITIKIHDNPGGPQCVDKSRKVNLAVDVKRKTFERILADQQCSPERLQMASVGEWTSSTEHELKVDVPFPSDDYYSHIRKAVSQWEKDVKWENCDSSKWKESARMCSLGIATLFMGTLGSSRDTSQITWRNVDVSGMCTFVIKFGFGSFPDGLRTRCIYLRQLRNQLLGHNRLLGISKKLWNDPALTITSATLTVTEEKGDKEDHELLLKCEKTLTIPRKRADFLRLISESGHGIDVTDTDKVQLVVKVRLYDDGTVIGDEKSVTLELAASNDQLVTVDSLSYHAENKALRMVVLETEDHYTITPVSALGLVQDLIQKEFIDYPECKDDWNTLLDSKDAATNTSLREYAREMLKCVHEDAEKVYSLEDKDYKALRVHMAIRKKLNDTYAGVGTNTYLLDALYNVEATIADSARGSCVDGTVDGVVQCFQGFLRRDSQQRIFFLSGDGGAVRDVRAKRIPPHPVPPFPRCFALTVSPTYPSMSIGLPCVRVSRRCRALAVSDSSRRTMGGAPCVSNRHVAVQLFECLTTQCIIVVGLFFSCLLASSCVGLVVFIHVFIYVCVLCTPRFAGRWTGQDYVHVQIVRPARYLGVC
jgi:hypothetical protein